MTLFQKMQADSHLVSTVVPRGIPVACAAMPTVPAWLPMGSISQPQVTIRQWWQAGRQAAAAAQEEEPCSRGPPGSTRSRPNRQGPRQSTALVKSWCCFGARVFSDL